MDFDFVTDSLFIHGTILSIFMVPFSFVHLFHILINTVLSERHEECIDVF